MTVSSQEGSGASHLKDGIIDLAAGTAGGIANVYAGQPLDTVKVKMQTFPHLYKNWVKCFNETFKADGIRGLYAGKLQIYRFHLIFISTLGTVPALVANIAENAVLFTAYGYCQKLVAFVSKQEDPDKMTPIFNAVSGSLAAVFAAMVLCPTELVKCRLQAQHELHPDVKRYVFTCEFTRGLLHFQHSCKCLSRNVPKERSSFFLHRNDPNIGS